ncbi:HelD family protein [Candidatus Enterococcus ferrettii]|uniref:DNA helicase II/ATP-dependent DNA helicase PcrA n=1 Tax=Candidatus Enterococcus ferrettii TaxID=2815324 RepID=A0ABV0EWX4_9ENTE|nr:UvrD-helicase domain-containing protein [Enterococcus sp. 665A]MBO1338742.1 AAA family ATPase [Enterococcus sp. 665A]
MNVKEEQYLKRVIKRVNEKADSLGETIDSNEDQYKELKRHTVDYKAELDKYEVYNYQQTMSFIDRRSTLETGILQKLNYQKSSPYFAKVGFQYQQEQEVEPFYIGRYGFADDRGEQLIYDWRAPIASLYYEFNLGQGSYESFGKIFQGNILEKKQFEIQDGEIQLLVDTEDTVNDEFLLQELSQSSSHEMKTIIQTIQKEQNEVIRNTKTKNLIIQGVAGSGKTAIALHRMAFLLYQKRASLTAEDILIISPNLIFSSYISNILPELGENDLQQLDITTLGKSFMEETVSVSSRQTELTEIIERPNSQRSKSYRYRDSSEFFEKLTAYLQQLTQQVVAEDLVLTQEKILSKENLGRFFENPRQQPLVVLIEQVSRRIAEEERLEDSKPVAAKLKKRIGFSNSLSAYLNFLSTLPQGCQGDSDKNLLASSDLYPYLYFKLRFEGIKSKQQIKHLVIDEMQDYSMLHFRVLQALFPGEKTICGDINQALTKDQQPFLEELSDLLPANQLVTFDKSYRSSYEIVEFAKQFVNNPEMTAVKRHGNPVEIIPVVDFPDKLIKLKQKLVEFQQSRFTTCGIICQSLQEVKQLITELSMPLTIINENTSKVEENIVLTTIQYAKGLEFDTVILPDIELGQLKQTDNRLYTSCTRALHQLIILTN